MATYAPTIANFYLNSAWKGYEETDGTNKTYSTPSTGYADYAYSLSGIPAGAIVDSAIVTSALGSPSTGIKDCFINYDGVDYNFRSGSLDITAKVQASLTSGAVSFRYKFKANGGSGSTSVGGTSHSASLGFDNNVITITYHMPVSSFSLSTSSLDAGQTITANINRADASYTHTVTFAFGSATQQYTGVATSQAFVIPLSWMNQIPNSTSGTASCTVQTYSGATLMGTAPTQYFTITVPASIKPTLTSLSASLVSGYWGLYVQGYSKATLTANGAAGTYGSTITGYSIAGGTSNPFTTGVLYTAGTNTFYATVTDSRGRISDAVSSSITVTAYAAPVITGVLVQRASSSLGTLADEGTYNKCTLSYSWSAIGSNTRTTAVDYKETTSSTWTSGSTALITSGGYIVLGSGTTFAIDKSYDIRFTVDDLISNPIYAYAVLHTAKYIMDFKVGGTGVCFGGVSTIDNAVEVSPNWEAYYKGQTLDSRFLAKTGGTLTGPITLPNFADGIIVGDDAIIGDGNVANAVCIRGKTDASMGKICFGSSKEYLQYSPYTFDFSKGVRTAGAITAAGIWSDTRITTGNQQMMNTDGSNIYLGNPVTTVYIEAGNLLFNIQGIKMPYHTGNLQHGTDTPSGGVDGNIYMQYI